MSAVDFVLGMAVISMGFIFVVFAEPLLSVIDLKARASRKILGTIRLLTGVGLILVAPAFRSSDLFRVLGILTLLGGVAFLLMSHETWVRFVRWWTQDHLTFYRFSIVTVLTLLGGAIVYSAFP